MICCNVVGAICNRLTVKFELNDKSLYIMIIKSGKRLCDLKMNFFTCKYVHYFNIRVMDTRLNFC